MSDTKPIPDGAKRTQAFYEALPDEFSSKLGTHFLDKAIDLAAELEEELNQARGDHELFDAAKEVVEVCYEGRREWAGYDQLAKRDLVSAASRLCSIVNRRLSS